MKLQRTWMLLVGFLLVAGLTGCADKPKPRADDPKPVVGELEPVAKKREATGQTQITNSLGMTLRLIPAGSFDMGTAEADADRLKPNDDWFFAGFVPSRRRAETPQHRVTLTNSFYMAAHEVTVAQFRRFIDATGYKTTADQKELGFGWRKAVWQVREEYNWKNPGFEQPDNHPVCNVSWDDVVEFCRWLSKKEGATYRLPTEAEWEYACRAGTTTLFSTGDDPSSLRGTANLADASLRREEPSVTWAVDWDDGYVATAPVGSFAPNAFGLYDMHGNVWEWCEDVYDYGYYERAPAIDPVHRRRNGTHVFRGGGFDNWPGFVRSADRYSSHSPTLRSQWAGFRVVIGGDLSGIGKER
jgi:sulfatase modifying factor 1